MKCKQINTCISSLITISIVVSVVARWFQDVLHTLLNALTTDTLDDQSLICFLLQSHSSVDYNFEIELSQ